MLLKDFDYNYDALQVYDSINIEKINEIVKKQSEIKIWNLKNKNKQREIPKILLIFDDVLGDSKITGFHSNIANFATKS